MEQRVAVQLTRNHDAIASIHDTECQFIFIAAQNQVQPKAARGKLTVENGKLNNKQKCYPAICHKTRHYIRDNTF